jgi:branched-chain amino acid transport system substrate-binding protein
MPSAPKIRHAVLATLLACAASHPAQAATIGFIGALSGPFAIVGQDQLDGLLLGIDQLGGKLGGQPVKVLKEDDQLKPDLGVQAVRKYVEREKVDAIVGLSASNVMMATLPRLAEAGVVALATQSGPSPIAGAQCKPNIFSMAWQNDGAAEAMGKYAQDKGLKKVFLIAPNFQAGKDMLAGFKRMFKGTIVDEVYAQFNQPDYSAEIAQIQSVNPEAVFAFIPGGAGVNFVKQMRQVGLLGKMPMYSVFTIDGTSMPALRDAAADNVIGAMYDAALDTPENKKFVAAFEARYKRTPSLYAATGFDAAQVLDLAFRKVNGKPSDQAALARAVKAAGSEIKSVRGPFRFNNNNLPIQNFYAFDVVKVDGKVVTKQVGVPLTDHGDVYHTQCAMK